MSEPVAKLDRRFSDPDAVATQWQKTNQVLDSAELFWICTVRASGQAHVTPLVAIWLDDTIYFCTGPEEQKALNLSGNSRVVLMTGCNDWETGIDVVLEGEALPVVDTDLLQRLAQAWGTKWDGRWHYQAVPGGFRHEGGTGMVLVFSVRPTKVFAFAKGTFGQTRYRF